MRGARSLIYSLLFVTSSSFAQAPQWDTGGNTMKWSRGVPQGLPGAAARFYFEFIQPAVGNVLTTDCYREQIWATVIEDVPPNISSFDVRNISQAQVIMARVSGVFFSLDRHTITVTTALVQDHGGPNNSCAHMGGAAAYSATFGLSQ
jgi:hypothetical protein